MIVEIPWVGWGLGGDTSMETGSVCLLTDPLETLFVPPDVDRAFRLYRANCGPASFAALLGCNICEVMEYFPGFRRKPVTNIPRMRAALRQSGLRFRQETKEFPTDGLVLIQIEGPWTHPKRFAYEAAYHRHWISARRDYVYDVNLDSWVPRQIWEEDYLPELVYGHEGATGWSVRTVFGIEGRDGCRIG